MDATDLLRSRDDRNREEPDPRRAERERRSSGNAMEDAIPARGSASKAQNAAGFHPSGRLLIRRPVRKGNLRWCMTRTREHRRRCSLCRSPVPFGNDGGQCATARGPGVAGQPVLQSACCPSRHGRDGRTPESRRDRGRERLDEPPRGRTARTRREPSRSRGEDDGRWTDIVTGNQAFCRYPREMSDPGGRPCGRTGRPETLAWKNPRQEKPRPLAGTR